MPERTPTNAGLQSELQLLERVRDYAIFLLDAEGRFRSWNSGAQSIHGYADDEILGRHFSCLHSPENVAAGKPSALLSTAGAFGRAEDDGWRLRKDGSRFWANVVITALLDADGKLDGFLTITRDLTEKKQAEQRLRASEERLGLFLQSVKDYAIILLDPEGYIMSWSGEAERLKGYTAREILGKHFSVLYPKEDVQSGKPRDALRNALENGRTEDEGWRVKKDGSRFWANVVISAVKDELGIQGFVKVTRDMTDRKRFEDELARRARQQAAVARFGLCAIDSLDLRRVLDGAVEVATSTLNVARGRIVELHADGTYHVRAGTGPAPDGAATRDAPPSVFPAAETGLAAQALVSREPIIVVAEEAGLSGEGGEAVEAMCAAIRSPGDGAPFGFLEVYGPGPGPFSREDADFLQSLANVIAAAIARLESEKRVRSAERAAEDERQRTLEAEEAVRARDVFLSVAAHELRSPIAALDLKLHTVSRQLARLPPGGIDETLARRIGDAVRQTGRLSGLVGRLLDVSRIASGKFKIDRESIDLSELTSEVLSQMREQAGGTDLRMTVAGDVTGYWDRRIEQAITNVLSNALKYGDGKPVSVRVEAAGPYVTLSVEDHGIGIAPEQIDRIFGAFERVAPHRNYGGLGLGLFIARGIVDAHGGSIGVESRPGEGSRFTIQLPRNDPRVR